MILSFLKHEREGNFAIVSDRWSCIRLTLLGALRFGVFTVSDRFMPVFIWRRPETIINGSKTFMQTVMNTARNGERLRTLDAKEWHAMERILENVTFTLQKRKNNCLFYFWINHFSIFSQKQIFVSLLKVKFCILPKCKSSIYSSIKFIVFKAKMNFEKKFIELITNLWYL